jgi:hypothetical protein
MLSQLISVDPTNIARENNLGEAFNFSEAVEPFRKIQKLFAKIKEENIGLLSDNQLNTILTFVTDMMNLYTSFLVFQPGSQNNPNQVRADLIQQIKARYQDFCDRLGPIIAFANSFAPDEGELNARLERMEAEFQGKSRAIETQLRQQLAQAETQRLQDAQRLAEISAAEQKRQADVLQQQTMAQQRSQELQRPQRIEPAPPSGKRKALVIGNDLYRHVTRLDNARADARAMSQSLQTLGFNVTLALDQTERGLKETLRNFKSSVEGGDEVVVFYAGHGVQIGTTNYLLPVDIAGQNEEQVRDEAIQMQRILDDMQERRTGFLLMIVDACRDNPFKVAGRTLGGRGLAPTSAATGQMVIFSAGTGQQALDKLGADDKEPNGWFTRLFLREMEKPGVSVDRVLRTVRTEVARLARSVGHEQTPALYDQSLGDFFFKP